MDRKLLCFGMLLLVSVSASAKQFYKCTGGDGNVTFGDVPCDDAKGGPKTVEIRGYQPPTRSPGDSSVSDQIQWLEGERAEKRARIQAVRARRAEESRLAAEQRRIQMAEMRQRQQQQQLDAIQKNSELAVEQSRRAFHAAQEASADAADAANAAAAMNY